LLIDDDGIYDPRQLNDRLVQLPLEKGLKNWHCGRCFATTSARPIPGGSHAGTSFSATHCRR
jgi:hypothetical protein